MFRRTMFCVHYVIIKGQDMFLSQQILLNSCKEDTHSGESIIVIVRFRTFGGEVKGGCSASGAITPVDSALSMAVLVVVQDAVCIIARVPEFPES